MAAQAKQTEQAEQERTPLSEAEREHLTDLYEQNQATQIELNKFVEFLRRQHGCPQDAGWGVQLDAFVRQPPKGA